MADQPVAMSVAALEVALADLGHHMAYPSTPNVAERVRHEIAQRPGPRRSLGTARLRWWWQSFIPAQRRFAVALVALIALAATILAVSPEARTVVAERLGLRGVIIREIPAVPTPLPTAAGARLSLGQPLTLEEVQTRITFQVLVPSLLGRPDEVYLGNTPPGGQVALVYYPRPDLPQANTTGVGLLLTAFQGNVPAGIFGKGVPPGTRIEEVQVNGGHGYWIEGDPHTIFYLDSRGQGRTETTRLAGNVLLWEQNQLTLRLESALLKDEVLRIAASVQ